MDIRLAQQNWQTTASDGENYSKSEAAQVFFTRTPQEYESAIDLVEAPAGADFFVGMVRITRTNSPSHQWWGRTLNPLQPENAWIPWMGSGLIEAGLGLARAMHLVIEDGYLKLIAEQTVGPACGGAVRRWGDGAGESSDLDQAANIFVTRQDREGGSFRVNTTPGIVVWTSTSSPYRTTNSATQNGLSFIANPTDLNSCPYGRPNAASTTDPTDYESVYSVDVRGHFGRRS